MKEGIPDMNRKLKITYNAPVTLSFVLICFAVTLLGMATGGRSTSKLFMTYRSSLLSPLTYIRLFTHVFGHSGWPHLIGNASYLLLLGPMLEEKYGSRTMVEIIALTAVVTGILNGVFFPHTALCGASGVAFAFILLASFTGFTEGEIPLTFILAAVIFLGQQVFEGITVKDNISNLAHVVGGLVGAAAGYVMNRRPKRGY